MRCFNISTILCGGRERERDHDTGVIVSLPMNRGTFVQEKFLVPSLEGNLQGNIPCSSFQGIPDSGQAVLKAFPVEGVLRPNNL